MLVFFSKMPFHCHCIFETVASVFLIVKIYRRIFYLCFEP